ncbi:hypothetical protein QCA50_003489 [Cerrena zonata]|uniref:Mitochondrial distribution and morphology protein 12 n=1 Tax=Cerrena zonata TaxID=2478898 RepID=A0AAW0GL07_9APHY
MSIDLEWNRLDSSLASSLIDALNRQLANTARPSFIGPVEITSLDFGTTPPDVELVDLRDIYRDFLEDDEEEEAEKDPIKVTEGPEGEDEDGFEWVSRKAARSHTLPEEIPAYSLLHPHMRYGPGRPQDMFASTPSLRSPRDMWNPALSNLAELRPTYPYSSGYASPMFRSMTAAAAAFRPPLSQSPMPISTPEKVSGSESEEPPAGPGPQTHPNLQVHLHISWHSNLRLTFTTSLLINYPSPMFMSLPIKLSVTGLLFDGEVVVGYEGERRRIHLCIVDDLDLYCPLGTDRPKRERDRDTPSSSGTPPDDDDITPDSIHTMHTRTRQNKPLPVGQRLLPSIDIESEIGQADKHVLKNVTRVERFIQDVIRKTVEEELVFPNFHTLVLPDAES